MFDSLRDKFQTFQDNLTTTLKGLSSTNDPLSSRQVINETISVNLNAGTDLLDKFQTAWSELHEASQENAIKAENVDGLICKLHKKTEKQWKNVAQLASCLASLPEVVHNVGELSKKILSLEELFDAVQVALTELEDIMDTRDFQNRQLEQRFQLALYEEKKLASLESVRMKLAENLAEKIRKHEVKQEKLLRECRIASEENFKEDLKVYKETNTIPTIEFAKSKSSKEDESSMLENIDLDHDDTSALDEFLNDSKNPEVEVTDLKDDKRTDFEEDVMEDIVLGGEDLSAVSESINEAEDVKSDEVKSSKSEFLLHNLSEQS